MNFFDEQMQQRNRYDEEMLKESMFTMASAVLGRHRIGVLRDARIITKTSIDELLKYYHVKSPNIPDTLNEPEEKLEYALRPHGIMYRVVKLTGDWYRDTYGPIMVFRRDDGMPVTLLPGSLQRYFYWDDVGKRHKVERRTMARFKEEALCFYRPLPLRRLEIPDLLTYINGCLNLNDILSVAGLALLVTVAGMMLPRFTGFLTGFVLESENFIILWSTAVFMLSVLIVSHIFSISRSLAMERMRIKVALSVESAVIMRLMYLPTSFFREYSSGDLASRCGAINRLCGLLMGSTFSLVVTALISLLYFQLIFLYAPALGITALIVVLAMTGVTALTYFLQKRVARTRMAYKVSESAMTYSVISGIQKIRLSGAEKRVFARWADLYAKCAEPEYNPPAFLKISRAVTLAVSLTGTVAMYYMAVRSGVECSPYLAFSAAYGTVTGAFSVMADGAVDAAEIRSILEMAEPILHAEPEANENREIVNRLSGNIELSGVSFRYSNTTPYVIDSLNLKIKAGEYIAIAGSSGCGKSTLVRLLLGFETPEKGNIYYDMKDIRRLDLRSLRRNMGVVPQNGSLFRGDIYSNITVSAPQLSMEEAWEAAELAGIADDIRAMPMGMHTVISEGQGGISGGQKQRLMIARAIAPKPRILIFDEATSALDNKTQKQVSNALDGFNCTHIVIAHRLSTIQNCDRVIVLDKGKIVEDGTFDQLMEKGGFFAELVKRQRIYN